MKEMQSQRTTSKNYIYSYRVLAWMRLFNIKIIYCNSISALFSTSNFG